jgi:hypothetical protein
VEIGEITGYSRTKINRCLAEGRERYRNLVARSEDGRRCAELQPLLSAFCDGEAGSEEVARVREHLRACAHCRATLRAYRAAPAAAAALAPALPLDRSLWERAHDAVAGLLARLGGGSTEPATQLAGGSAGGLGVAGVAKVAALCVGTAGGAAACVAGGIVPVPLDLSAARERPPLERRLSDRPTPATPTPTVAYEPEPTAPEPRPEPKSKPQPEPAPSPAAPAASPSEPVVEAAPVASSGEAESAPPPAPEPTAAPAPPLSSSGGGSPAGEFGP